MPHRPQTQKKPPPQDQHRWYPYAPASAGVWCEEPQPLQPGHGDCQRGAPLRRPQTQKAWRQPQRETRFFIHLFDLLVFHVISHIDHILPTIFLTITPGAGGQMAETTIKAKNYEGPKIENCSENKRNTLFFYDMNSHNLIVFSPPRFMS